MIFKKNRFKKYSKLDGKFLKSLKHNTEILKSKILIWQKYQSISKKIS